jgi:hypothetical protein
MTACFDLFSAFTIDSASLNWAASVLKVRDKCSESCVVLALGAWDLTGLGVNPSPMVDATELLFGMVERSSSSGLMTLKSAVAALSALFALVKNLWHVTSR